MPRSAAFSRLSTVLPILLASWLQFPSDIHAQQEARSTGAAVAEVDRPWQARGAAVRVQEKALLLDVSAEGFRDRKVVIPRLNAPIRRLHWLTAPQAALKFVPEPTEWVVTWDKSPAEARTIEILFDQIPLLPSDAAPNMPEGDGSIMLHAFQVATFGEKLRFEPQPHKNTVGYWTVTSDYAIWRFSLEQPGTYSVAVLQGCGEGQGGSEGLLSIRQGEALRAELVFQTIDTGHFQNFRWNHLGHVSITDPGTYELKIEPKRIAKNALFDVRAIHLVRQASSGL